MLGRTGEQRAHDRGDLAGREALMVAQCRLAVGVDDLHAAADQAQPQRSLPHRAHIERHRPAPPGHDAGAHIGDLLAVAGGELGRVGVIEADGGIPVAACLGAQLGQVAGGVLGIGGGVEGLGERGEGVRMHLQIDLQAADVDERHAAGERQFGPDDGRLLALEEDALAVGIDGPGPGADVGERADRPSALDLGHGAEQAGGAGDGASARRRSPGCRGRSAARPSLAAARRRCRRAPRRGRGRAGRG